MTDRYCHGDEETEAPQFLAGIGCEHKAPERRMVCAAVIALIRWLKCLVEASINGSVRGKYLLYRPHRLVAFRMESE